MHAVRAGLLCASVLAAFTPLSLPAGASAARPTAACPTCCPQEGATCVICGTQTCTPVPNSYEGKVGPGGCTTQT